MAKTLLDRKAALEITANIEKILDAIKATGTVVILKRDGNVLDTHMIGQVRPITLRIATLKAKQSLYTGERTGATAEKVKDGRSLKFYEIDPETFVPFAGGCPITDSAGNILGAAGFSEQTAQTDEDILATAIEGAGFLSTSPERINWATGPIKNALKKKSNK